MSAGVSDQRMKGQGNQVSNGSKEPLGAAEGATGSEGFEPWRTQQNSAAHTGYGPTVPISSATDLYNMSTAGYYGNAAGTYPYQTYGVSDGTWSNGTDMTFLSGYPPDSYSMDGIPYSYQNNPMFGTSTTFSTATFQGQPSSFNYFPSNGDYNTWSNQLSGQRKYDEFYGDPPNMYPQPIPESAVKSVEHAMQSLELKSSSDNKDLGQQKKTTWASIASQPAKPPLAMPSQGLKKKGPGMPPGPIVPGKHNIDIGTWETNKSTPQVPMPMVTCAPLPLPPQLKTSVPPVTGLPVPGSGSVRPGWNGPPPTARQPQVLQPPPPRGLQHQHQMPPASAFQQPPIMPTHLPPQGPPPNSHIQGMMPAPVQLIMSNSPSQQTNHPLLEELRGKNNYNPTDFDLSAANARFFVIKSYSEDDIHRSIKYDIWCSTEHGNKRLDLAYREREGNGCVYLFFSVNGSGHFCGMAQMITAVDYNSNSSVWSQDKWKGQFKVRWIYVKDVPNVQLRHIHLENNENKSVTNSRDAQEVPHARGLQVLRIMHSYRHSTSIFDDFIHYEKRQEEEDNRKQPVKEMGHHEGGGEGRGRGDHHRGGRNHDRDGDRDRNDGHRGGGHRGERGDRDGHHGGGGGGGGHHRDRDNRSRGGRGGGRN